MSAKTIAELVKSSQGRVAVTTFASNVARLRAVADAARAADREVVVVGRAMERVIQVARETGYLDGVQDFRPVDAYGYLPPNKVVGVVYRQPGRAARGACPHRRGPASRGDAHARRPRDHFGAHNTRQREGCRPRAQWIDRPGHRGDHRPHSSGACVGPSAPRRARRPDWLGQAANPHPGARRGLASIRARRACQAIARASR